MIGLLSLCFCDCSASNMAFKEELKQIESSPECGGLPMISFLILPMQRVTRLPLLMDVRTPHPKITHPAMLSLGFVSLNKWKLTYCSWSTCSMQLFIVMTEIVLFCTFMQTICQKTAKNTIEYYAARWAFKAISKVQCAHNVCVHNHFIVANWSLYSNSVS